MYMEMPVSLHVKSLYHPKL